MKRLACLLRLCAFLPWKDEADNVWRSRCVHCQRIA